MSLKGKGQRTTGRKGCGQHKCFCLSFGCYLGACIYVSEGLDVWFSSETLLNHREISTDYFQWGQLFKLIVNQIITPFFSIVAPLENHSGVFKIEVNTKCMVLSLSLGI